MTTNVDILNSIGAHAVARAAALDPRARSVLLHDASAPMPPEIAWTEYEHGVFDTQNGARREAPWAELGRDLFAYARRVVGKGVGRWMMGATSKNGGCRDADVDAITMLVLDCDGAGEWGEIRAVLEEAQLAHIVQRSSSHTSEVPKWHLLLPLARPWQGSKAEWRAIWRFVVGWFAAAAGLPCDVAGDPPAYGFDPKTDRLGQPSFPAARRDRFQAPPETLCAGGNALELDAFLAAAGFDRAEVRVLEVESPPLGARTCPPEHGLLALAFAEAGMLRHRIERGDARGYAVICPTEHLHSGPRRNHDDSTVIFDPRPGATKGHLHCKHRCGDRGWKEALALLPDDAVARAQLRWSDARRARAVAEGGAERPRITIGPDEHAVNDQAVAALARDPLVYQSGGRLVRVVVDPRTRAPRIAPITLPTLRELLAANAEWIRVKEQNDGELEEVHTHPPDWCVRAVHDRVQWDGVRVLVGVTEAPVLRPDGTVLQEEGYDASTGLVYLPHEAFPAVADRPAREDALCARDALLEVVRDFPFATDAHRAAWLALLLTLFARPAIAGCVPMVAIDATTRGTGKGRLADATANILMGRDGSKTPQPKDDDEMRKRITSLLLEGEKLIVLDNIARPVGDPSLDACLTATEWKDRALGRNETVRVPNLALWIATGNNIEFAGDTARRVLHIRLESKVENPENRDDFAHPDLLAWVRAERSRLVAAALTILRAYFIAGCPKMACKGWGSFEAWSRLVAHCVAWTGLPDPQATRAALEAASDTTRSALGGLLAAWEELQGVLDEGCQGLAVGAVLKALYPPPPRPGHPPLPDTHPCYAAAREAIEAIVATPPGRAPSAQKLGMHLHHVRGRIVGGRLFSRAGEHGHAARWRVRRANGAEDRRGTLGTEGTTSNPSRGKMEEGIDHVYAYAHARTRVCEGASASPPSPLGPLTLEAEDVRFDAEEREAIRTMQ